MSLPVRLWSQQNLPVDSSPTVGAAVTCCSPPFWRDTWSDGCRPLGRPVGRPPGHADPATTPRFSDRGNRRHDRCRATRNHSWGALPFSRMPFRTGLKRVHLAGLAAHARASPADQSGGPALPILSWWSSSFLPGAFLTHMAAIFRPVALLAIWNFSLRGHSCATMQQEGNVYRRGTYHVITRGGPPDPMVTEKFLFNVSVLHPRCDLRFFPWIPFLGGPFRRCAAGSEEGRPIPFSSGGRFPFFFH